eukprot:CAMPEP_0202444104 /NCGR_PEP_ID=MMETSP1360-20130828/3247_1 /ASSEMBLY_ACC=CAM_ASM_000848 /TAXON_ID=515479 /ORGANISM="Licmophora paradoxa, Strain CCMP2313" /LENGTH=180 /DNA_ID=CAMNT_0049059999 /DNA_START=120 /DNA_END=662 /DNA_ORIENTATION=+
MSSYEVMYFALPGRAEAVRVMLHAAGIDFTDTTFGFKEWPTIKPTTPLGSVPVLKIDGKEYTQSMAMARFAAKKAGFYPEDPLEALKVDEAIDIVAELLSKVPKCEDKDEMKKLREEFQKETMTKYAIFLENRVQMSGGNSIASSPSVADLILKTTIGAIETGFWDYIDTKFFDQYPGIM